jgi:hypothetical protein
MIVLRFVYTIKLSIASVPKLLLTVSTTNSRSYSKVMDVHVENMRPEAEMSEDGHTIEGRRGLR